jgi:hypothetical protein
MLFFSLQVIVHKILKDIVENCGGKIPIDLAEWPYYHEEMGLKSSGSSPLGIFRNIDDYTS